MTSIIAVRVTFLQALCFSRCSPLLSDATLPVYLQSPHGGQRRYRVEDLCHLLNVYSVSLIIDPRDLYLTVSLLFSGSMVGAPFAAILSDRLGRRRGMFSGAIVILLGMILAATSKSIGQVRLAYRCGFEKSVTNLDRFSLWSAVLS